MKKQEKRPKIKLKLSLFDKAIEIFAVALLLFMITNIISVYGNLPDIIPIHYNLKGEVDRYSNKAALFVLVFICFFNYTLLTIINFFPHTFNYSVKITQENAEKQYILATRLIRKIKFLTTLLFFTISNLTVNIAQAHQISFLNSFIWIITIIAIIAITVIYYIIKMRKEK